MSVGASFDSSPSLRDKDVIYDARSAAESLFESSYARLAGSSKEASIYLHFLSKHRTVRVTGVLSTLGSASTICKLE